MDRIPALHTDSPSVRKLPCLALGTNMRCSRGVGSLLSLAIRGSRDVAQRSSRRPDWISHEASCRDREANHRLRHRGGRVLISSFPSARMRTSTADTTESAVRFGMRCSPIGTTTPSYECGSAAIPRPRSASRLTSGRAARSRSASAKCSPAALGGRVCCAWAASFPVKASGSVFTHHRGRLLEWRKFRPTAFP